MLHGAVPVFVGMCGDWNTFAETFNRQTTWSTEETCVLCRAHKTADDLCLANALPNAPWVHTHRSHLDYIRQQEELGARHPFTKIPGIHIHNLNEDALHDDMLGMRPLAVASALKELVDLDFFGESDLAGGWKYLWI